MKAYLVCGLAFGDESKGSCVDYLVRQTGAKLVVRYSGGPQCGHNVITPDGRHHAFSQFGSGSFVPGVRTYLSRFMLIEPYALLNEWEILSQKVDSRSLEAILAIDGAAPVITPFHWILNRLRERKRGNGRHGSCGMGVGELRADQVGGSDVILAADLRSSSLLMMKLGAIKSRYSDYAFGVAGEEGRELIEAQSIREIAVFYIDFAKQANIVPTGFLSLYSGGDPVVFEGAQGVLLDETHGFAPYNTWTDTTFRNAYCLTGIHDEIIRVGVLRTYFTRHGPGPFVSESDEVKWPDHNTEGVWQGPFRQGYFDMIAARYAVKCIGGVDVIALNHLDRIEDPNSSFIACVTAYGNDSGSVDGDDLCSRRATDELMKARPADWDLMTPGDIQVVLGASERIDSYGPTASDKEGMVLHASKS